MNTLPPIETYRDMTEAEAIAAYKALQDAPPAISHEEVGARQDALMRRLTGSVGFVAYLGWWASDLELAGVADLDDLTLQEIFDAWIRSAV